MQALSPFMAFWTSLPFTADRTFVFPSFNSALNALRRVTGEMSNTVAISSCVMLQATIARA